MLKQKDGVGARGDVIGSAVQLGTMEVGVIPQPVPACHLLFHMLHLEGQLRHQLL